MNKWKLRNRPIRLEGRYEFDSYESTRKFLDELSELSEAKQCFPDMSFGKTYVNIIIRPESDEPDAELLPEDHSFAAKIDELFDSII